MATNHSLCPWDRDSKTITISVYSILTLLSLVGNVLIVAVFYRNNRLRTTVHYFIVIMAVSDLLIPTIFLPMQITVVYYERWFIGGILGTTLCKFVWFTVYVSVAVSMISMVAIAVDRFYAIVFAMKLALFSQKNCKRLIIATWIFSMAIQSYYIYAVRLEGAETMCNYALERISFLCLFSSTALFLTALYSAIIVFLYHQKANLHLASKTVKLRAKENRRVTSMLVILVVAFYLVWILFFIHDFITQDLDYCARKWKWIVKSMPLWYTVVNSVVFFIFNETFRQGSKELLCRPWFCSNLQQVHINICSLASVSPQEHGNNASNSNHQIHDVSVKKR